MCKINSINGKTSIPELLLTAYYMLKEIDTTYPKQKILKPSQLKKLKEVLNEIKKYETAMNYLSETTKI
jgi:hypothetical protein